MSSLAVLGVSMMSDGKRCGCSDGEQWDSPMAGGSEQCGGGMVMVSNPC